MNQSVINTSIIAIALIISAFVLSEGFEIEFETKEGDYKKFETKQSQAVLINMEEASKILGLSEKTIKRIIVAEESTLEKRGSFTGTMFPYIKIDGEYYFSKESILRWVHDNAGMKREYDGFNVK
jgi:predicted DNA-binding transcriptional regulator AlpA